MPVSITLSQMIVNEDGWLSLVSKILIISLAIMIARKKYVTQRRNNEQIYFKTISRDLVCIDCPPCYLSSRASYPWFFPVGTSIGASLLFILMNCIPLITAAVFSLVLGEVKSLGDFFKKVFLQKESFLSWILAFIIPSLLWDLHPAYECSLYWELPLCLLPIFPLDLFIWRPGRSRLALVFYKIIFPLVSTLYLK